MRIPWRAIGRVNCVPLAEGSILFHEDSPRLFALNQSATQIWHALGRGTRRETAVRALMNGYGLSREESIRQVEAALAAWHSAGLFVRQRDAADVPDSPPTAGRFHSEKTYAICGRRVRVRYDTAGHEQQLHPRMAHLAVDGSSDAPLVQLSRCRHLWWVTGPEGPRQTRSSSEAVGLLFRTMIEAANPGLEPCAQFHAAAVSHPGGAVLLPGRKGCGKTTLTAALLTAGFDYLTDDVVVMDAGLNVVPLPLALSIKEGSTTILEQILPGLAQAAPVKIGGAWIKYLPVTDKPRPGSSRLIRAIIFPRFRAGASPELQRLTPLDGLRLLAECGAWFSRERKAAEKWASWLGQTPSYSLVYSELEDGIRSVREVAV